MPAQQPIEDSRCHVTNVGIAISNGQYHATAWMIIATITTAAFHLQWVGIQRCVMISSAASKPMPGYSPTKQNETSNTTKNK
mmetsp:Transcript_20796/g.57809  ORF Transcript_20796/g.57809 Transcript_20796/m.57809 type:complete len:82 (-) Transcript_20796:325-570(-)